MSDYIVGRNAVLEALEEGKVEKIYVLKGERKGSIHKILGKAKAMHVVVREADRNELERMAEGIAHQGVAALVPDFEYATVEEILAVADQKGQPHFIVVLDEIEDPHNLGAILRTAEVAGVDGVILPKRRSASITQTVHKVSAGATSHLPVARVANIHQTLERLKKENIWIYGADGEGTEEYTRVDLKGSVALVIGNEGKGLHRVVKEACDGLVRIPMFGKVSSLNASNAAAVLIYEVVRQNHVSR